MLTSFVEQVAVVLRSNELLDQAKQVLDESRQATEVQYSDVMQDLAEKDFSLRQGSDPVVCSNWRLVQQLAGRNHISCSLQVQIY
jgi:hypothetical protein